MLSQVPVSPEAANSLVEYGIAGTVILILFGIVIFLLKDNRTERKEWRLESIEREKSQEHLLSVSTKVQSELTAAIEAQTSQTKETKEVIQKIREGQVKSLAVQANSK